MHVDHLYIELIHLHQKKGAISFQVIYGVTTTCVWFSHVETLGLNENWEMRSLRKSHTDIDIISWRKRSTTKEEMSRTYLHSLRGAAGNQVVSRYRRSEKSQTQERKRGCKRPKSKLRGRIAKELESEAWEGPSWKQKRKKFLCFFFTARDIKKKRRKSFFCSPCFPNLSVTLREYTLTVHDHQFLWCNFASSCCNKWCHVMMRPFKYSRPRVALINTCLAAYPPSCLNVVR